MTAPELLDLMPALLEMGQSAILVVVFVLGVHAGFSY